MVSRELDSSKNILVDFLNHPGLKKRYQKVAELAGDCRELRNCGSQILKVRNRSSATFFSPQLRNGFGCPQYCGVAEVRTKIADAQLWLLGYPGKIFCEINSSMNIKVARDINVRKFVCYEA